MSRENLYLFIGGRIRSARKEKGWALEDLSSHSGTGLSRSALSKIEQGKQQLYVHQLLQLGQALGLDIKKLLTQVEYPTSSSEDELPSFIRNI